MAVWRVSTAQGERLARGPVSSGPAELLRAGTTIDQLLAAGSLDAPADGAVPAGSVALAPVHGQEVWAAGVTYESSRVARNEDVYPWVLGGTALGEVLPDTPYQAPDRERQLAVAGPSAKDATDR